MLELLGLILQTSAPCCPVRQGWTGMALDGTITVGEIANILANILIAILIAVMLTHFLAARSEARRTENSILAGHIQDAFDAIRKCQQRFSISIGRKPNKDEAQEIVGAVEHISSALAELEIALEFSHCSDMKSCCDSITTSFLQYKRSLTGNSFPNRKFTQIDQGEADEFQRRMKKELHSMLFKIGRHR